MQNKRTTVWNGTQLCSALQCSRIIWLQNHEVSLREKSYTSYHVSALLYFR